MKIMTCTKCGKKSHERCFAKFKHRDGRIGRRNVCLECRSAYHQENFDRLKEYRKNYNEKNRTKKAKDSFDRRQKILAITNKIKQESPCSDCGRFFPAVAMDFDHTRGKNKGISNMVSQAYKIDLILEEIKLCDIVCACCHRVRTATRKQNLAPRRAQDAGQGN